jgi:hypothetical protein
LGDTIVRLFYADTITEPTVPGDWTEITLPTSIVTLTSNNYRFEIYARNASTSQDISWKVYGAEEWT